MAQGLSGRIKGWGRRWIKRNATFIYIRQKSLTPYLKPYRTPQELVAKLQAMGLVVPSVVNAEATLTAVSYYRFKIYLRPFLAAPDFKAFIPGSSFEDACQLHDFDRDLRSMIMALTAIIEVNLRHEIDRVIGQFLGDAFWYLRKDIYLDVPSKTLSQIYSSMSRSGEDFTRHFFAKYFNRVGLGRYSLLPPFWMTVETLSIGQLLYLMRSLDKKPFDVAGGGNLLDGMGKKWGAYNFHDLERWVEYIRNMRNWSAHHSRLWSRNMGIPPGIERLLSPSLAGAIKKKNRIYLSLAMIRVILKSGGQQDGVAQAMHSLFMKYPAAHSKMEQMGFPVNWQNDPFWT